MIRYQLVGGAVHDKLLEFTVKDRNWVVTGATPQAMLQRGFLSAVSKDFPVFLPKHMKNMPTAHRARKTAAGYHGFQFHAAPEVTLAEDLQRRD
ncbi:MAG: hypothetical protein R3E95_20085 [Thiolinea sp.]